MIPSTARNLILLVWRTPESLRACRRILWILRQALFCMRSLVLSPRSADFRRSAGYATGRRHMAASPLTL